MLSSHKRSFPVCYSFCFVTVLLGLAIGKPVCSFAGKAGRHICCPFDSTRHNASSAALPHPLTSMACWPMLKTNSTNLKPPALDQVSGSALPKPHNETWTWVISRHFWDSLRGGEILTQHLRKLNSLPLISFFPNLFHFPFNSQLTAGLINTNRNLFSLERPFLLLTLLTFQGVCTTVQSKALLQTWS